MATAAKNGTVKNGAANPAAESTQRGRHSEIPLAAVRPMPGQPRRHFDPDELQRLAASIERHGLLEPLLVRPLAERGVFELVAGERRWRAAKLLGWQRIPAIVRADLDAAGAFETALAENVDRKDLNPIEMAAAVARLVAPVDQGGFGRTHLEVARLFGRKGDTWAAHTMSLLKLPDAWQQRVIAGELPARSALEIARYAHRPDVLAAIEQDMHENPWAWGGWRQIAENARIVAGQVAEARRHVSAETAAAGHPSPHTPAIDRGRGRRPAEPPVDAPEPPATGGAASIGDVSIGVVSIGVEPCDKLRAPAANIEPYYAKVSELMEHIRQTVADWPSTARTLLRHRLSRLVTESLSPRV